ncbi:hypothetical protein CHUAL_000369 [Chamberlinius hualienensis]
MISKKLFTPGPLNCKESVKSAMLQDFGSRDAQFIDSVKYIRQKLLEIAEVTKSSVDTENDRQYTVVPIQGSGTYAVEAVLKTSTPRNNGKVLVLANGSYGMRINLICVTAGINVHMLNFPETDAIDVKVVEDHLKLNPSDYTTIAAVHCETSSGIVNRIEDIGKLIKKHSPHSSYFVDAMSSFGAVPIDINNSNIDYLVSSANKCLEGVPGFAFVIANISKLLACKGNSRSLSLDLLEQYLNLEKFGQFRFTPPTHTMMAFKQALTEYEIEGGLPKRAERYSENSNILREGMKKLGFDELIENDQIKSYIITAFRYPNDRNFNFEEFYQRLGDLGQVIYPGKVTNADCFRIGNIGQLYSSDMKNLLESIKQFFGMVAKTLEAVLTWRPSVLLNLRFSDFRFPGTRMMNCRPKGNHAYVPTEWEHVANIITHGLLIIPISTVFHCVFYHGKFGNLKDILHRCDRAIIYVFIAASYTPWLILKEMEPDRHGQHMWWLVWLLALLGMTYQHLYKWLETLLYTLLGWIPSLAVFHMQEWSGLFELAVGGGIYMAGIFFFKSDGRIPCAHAIWHMFVSAAACVHFYAVCKYLLGRNDGEKYGFDF